MQIGNVYNSFFINVFKNPQKKNETILKFRILNFWLQVYVNWNGRAIRIYY